MDAKTVARFWSKVEKTEGCWLWTGNFGPKGYGTIGAGGKQWRAHRLAWLLENGEIPENLFVCHHCDNVKCVRASHLFLGTNTDNMRDMVQKGRQSRKPSHTKLTAEQVISARQRHPQVCYRELAREFGVTFECVKNAVRGFTWANLNHLEPPGAGGSGGWNSAPGGSAATLPRVGKPEA